MGGWPGPLIPRASRLAVSTFAKVALRQVGSRRRWGDGTLDGLAEASVGGGRRKSAVGFMTHGSFGGEKPGLCFAGAVFRMRCALFALFAAAGLHAGTPQEADFTDTLFTSGLNQPTCLAWAPDGSNRLFVSLKDSGIGLIENGVLRPTLFATFPELYTASECGVLGLAFDPDYATNRYVYVFVTVSSSEQRIVRFTDQNNLGTQRTTILGGLPTKGANHDGGALAFGQDGKLYFAIGDLGDKTGVDGNLTSLAAKVGRSNKDGSVPADNPFADGPGGANDYIFATGFRNPFTMTFRPGTNQLWLNVVGSTPGGQTVPNSGPGYEQVFIVRAGDDGGYDDYEGNQPANPRYTTPFARPLIRPKIQYKTDYFGGGNQTRTVASAQRSGGTLTVTTTANHPFRVGQAVVLTGVGALGGTYTIASVPGPGSFTCVAPGAAAQASSGSVEPLVQGGSITGGCFATSTALPATHRGNFFYGDYVGGYVLRAVVAADGTAQRITRFVEDAGGVTDVAEGPDGALYYADIFSGQVRRVAYTGTPGLIVSPTTLDLVEGGTKTFTVRLGAAPAGPVLVQIHQTNATTPGAHDLEVSGGAVLAFTGENWDRPQPVAITALVDADGDPDTATFAVTAPGYETVEVLATAVDENQPAILLSAASGEVAERARFDLLVSLEAAPPGPVKVRVRPQAGPQSRVKVNQGALLRFTPENFATPQRVRFKAVADADRNDHVLTYKLTAPGFRARPFALAVRDVDPLPPAITSPAVTQAVVGLAYRYEVTAKGRPAPLSFSLTQNPAGMQIDAGTGVLTWIPPSTGTFPVTIRVANSEGSATQSYTLQVDADQPPIAYLLAPLDGSTLSGAGAEFFGSSADDYGTWKAEFYVDGQLVYTDANRDAHYHCGGAHNRFDTTAFSNGPHVVKMVVTDDAGQTGEATAQITIANP